MVRFFIEIAIFILLAFLVYITSLSLPRISEEEWEVLRQKQKERILYLVEKGDFYVKSLWEKILRKLKVWLLSWNNFLEAKLNRLKKDIAKIESSIKDEENKNQ